jgi:tyrosine-protein kinase Etk/Wzc
MAVEFATPEEGLVSSDRARNTINPLGILVLLTENRLLIFRIGIVITLLAAAVVFLMPQTFTGRALLVPPQQSQTNAMGLIAQLNPLAANLGKDFGLKNSSDLYVAMLKSRTVADNLINRFDLRKVYGEKTYIDTRSTLEDRTRLKATREGLVEIAVDDRSPERAAELANAYITELQALTQDLAITEASQRRLFYERQLTTAKDNLAEAELALKQTQEKTGLIAFDAQSRAIITAVGTVKGQIAAKEVQIQRMKLFATSENPDLQAAEQELAALRGQLISLERKERVDVGDVQLATSKVPAAGLEYVRQLRNVKYHETIFELLSKQFEIAKLDESKDAVLVQVLDKAVVPEKRSSPKRGLVIGISCLLGLVTGVLWVLMRRFWELLRQDPEDASRIDYIRGAFLGRASSIPKA